MTDDDKRAMQAAWYEWHAGVSLHIMPAINTSFGRGFEAGMAHAMGASHAVIARLRGENAVLADILRAPSPFSDDILIACPKCKEVGSLIVACDETECWKEATCGTPTADDYRMTCFDHRPIDDGETKCAS